MLPVLAVAFASLCVWLAVRIVNRRERWVKWMAVAVLSFPVLYVASFGPACWWLSNISALPHGGMRAHRRVPAFYHPISWAARRGPTALRGIISWYATLGLGDETMESETLEGDQYTIIVFAK